ncbi:N-6 DNA methylase [Oceanirhabdus sp. W0125-5]|uniref:N-6 DNA methylase n=1 Tax=Oceanirhabdus sp. W0125-5 TaxID=2999116 RepID=UPI0022F308EE|nr:N-6 DNA methylase [Oceanirhabdus sp. W0125-5]WBW98092.1 N-6 DNA methylase [Oceanirhabdus sp. W0125-5]
MNNKSELLDIIKKSLNKIGYDNEKIIDEYPITTKDENVIYFDFIAFGHNKIQDTSTSCITVKYCEDEREENKIIEDAKYSASPLLMISKKKTVGLWKLDVEKKSDKIIELKYNDLGNYFAENRVNYDYSKIVSAKYEREQLSFFNTNNLFQFASKINCELLGKEFKKAIFSVRKLINQEKTDEIADITSIVMHVIAAKILNDKLVLNKRFTDIHKLIAVLSKQYGDYFNKEHLYKYGNELIDTINDSFSSELSYRSIDNKILGNFYESTLFESDESKNKKLKREFGIYYTPSCIVNNLMKSMPIELIDFRNRCVLDASCGSGSLLIGAYKRLKDLLPINMQEELQHEYLTDMIHGIDIDRFACEVARLELLLNSIPYGNGWKVESGDFLKISNRSLRPNIVIANPPYEEKRKNTLTEKASVFLEKYIDILDHEGLIGIVLPQTFLTKKSSKNARKKLLQNIQLHEVWLLPKGIFDTNNCATTVIIGRKQDKIENKSFKARIVVQKSTDIFKNTGKFDFEFLCDSQISFLESKNYQIIVSPVKKLIDKLKNKNKLSEYVDDTQGIQIPYDKYPLISDDYKDGYSKYFRNARQGVSRYKFDWSKQKKSRYIYYDPDNLVNIKYTGKNDKGLRLRGEKQNILKSKKVVIPINSTPGTFWRIKAAIDYEGIYPSHSLWCFVPKNENITLEVIVAILNSKITNLYLENVNLEMTLNSNNLRDIPFPDLTEKQKESIARCVKQIENDIESEENMKLIDDILYEGFNLSEDEIKCIESYYIKFTSSKCHIQNQNYVESIEVTGKVLDIDIDNKIIKASFVECEEEKFIKVTNEIPGWLLAEQAPFVCRMPEEDFYEEEISIMNVRPLQYTYLNDQDYQNLIINKFNDYKPHRADRKKFQNYFLKEEA